MPAKPSTQIVLLIEARMSPDGSATLTPDDVAEIKRLTRVIDRRDQQARKPRAKKKARKASR